MKEFISYWKKNQKWIWLTLAFALIFTVVLLLYDIPAGTIWYAFVLCLTVETVVCFIGFVRYYGKCRRLQEQSININICVPEEEEPEDLLENYYQEMVHTLFDEKAKMESDSRIGKKEMLDYYSLWVHQIKTPIAAMRILLQAADELPFEKRTELEMELFKIEQYVEMALSYIRLGDMSSDLNLQWYSVDEIVKPAVKKYSKLFILKKIRLEYEPIENKILTDEKWLGLVVEQILSNALKYTLPDEVRPPQASVTGCPDGYTLPDEVRPPQASVTGCPDGYTLPDEVRPPQASVTGCPNGYTNEGKISIYMDSEKQNVLVIEDTGIGIYQEDLPRVFEKGFTGYNGRTDKKSTGIGLYLCKSIVDKLNHRIYISSEVSKGTKIFLNLNRDDFQLE